MKSIPKRGASQGVESIPKREMETIPKGEPNLYLNNRLPLAPLQRGVRKIGQGWLVLGEGFGMGRREYPKYLHNQM